MKVKACTRFRHLVYRIPVQCEILLIVFKFFAINLLRSYKNNKVRQWSCGNVQGVLFCAVLLGGALCYAGCILII